MSLEKLTEEIKSEAESKVKAIMDEAKLEAKAILAKAESVAREIEQKMKVEALEQCKLEGVKISAAKLEAKRIVSEAKEKLIQKTIQELRRELGDFAKSKEYRPFLEKLIKRNAKEFGASAGAGLVVLARKADEKIVSQLGFKFEPFDTIGGAIIQARDGSVKIDCSFEASLEENGDEIRRRAHSFLFSK